MILEIWVWHKSLRKKCISMMFWYMQHPVFIRDGQTRGIYEEK